MKSERFIYANCQFRFDLNLYLHYLPATLNVKDPVPVQLPLLLTLQVTVCKPTPKFPPVRATFPPPTESKQVTFWSSVLLAVTLSHMTDTIELPPGIHWSSTRGRDSTGVAVQEKVVQPFSFTKFGQVLSSREYFKF